MIGNNFPIRRNAFCLSSEKRAISAQMSPAGTLCFDIFSPLPDDSEVISQIERLSSNETKIAPRSLRMALGASGRSAVTCMAVSRVGVRNLTLPERRSLSTSPWDLEGLDEMLTVTRLGLPPELRRSLACTNIIENVMGTVRRVCRNVKYWRSPSMALRWAGAAMQEAAKGFRRLKAHKQLPLLKAALAKRKAKAVPSNEHLAQTTQAA
jgi:hypothetical protein